MSLGAFVEWHEDWSQLFRRCNWYTFTFFRFEVEDDRIMGGVESTLILLGLGVRVRWNWRETEKTREIDAAMEEMKENPLDNTFVSRRYAKELETQLQEARELLSRADYYLWISEPDNAETWVERRDTWMKEVEK